MDRQYVVIRWGKRKGDCEGVAVFSDREKALDYWQACHKGGHPAAITVAEINPQPPAPKPVQMQMF